jgi:hypothetical protein
MKTYSWRSAGIFLLLLMSFGCHHHHHGIEEVPPDIIQSIPCPTLYSRILELFPEHSKATGSILFADTVQKNVVLTKQSEVYVTFIDEGAGYQNSFGWYTYNINSPPTFASQLELNILFPNVSNNVLDPGDKLLVGSFPAGTVVGFFLLVNGWQNNTINYNQPKVYTDFRFNQGGIQQHILFQEKTCGDIVLAFEDVTIGGTSDKDFNDILFTVSDNNSDKVNTAFATQSIVRW